MFNRCSIVWHEIGWFCGDFMGLLGKNTGECNSPMSQLLDSRNNHEGSWRLAYTIGLLLEKTSTVFVCSMSTESAIFRSISNMMRSSRNIRNSIYWTTGPWHFLPGIIWTHERGLFLIYHVCCFRQFFMAGHSDSAIVQNKRRTQITSLPLHYSTSKNK
jgi:hypothetical protein